MKSVDFMSQDKLGTYAKLVPSNDTKKQIHKISNQLNIENLISKHALHTTVIYSRVKCYPEINPESIQLPIFAKGKRFDIFDNSDKTHSLVLVLESTELSELHEHFRKMHNATHDFPEYQPHITLSYDYNHRVPNHTILEHFQNIEFSEFVVEPLDFDKF